MLVQATLCKQSLFLKDLMDVLVLLVEKENAELTVFLVVLAFLGFQVTQLVAFLVHLALKVARV